MRRRHRKPAAARIAAVLITLHLATGGLCAAGDASAAGAQHAPAEPATIRGLVVDGRTDQPLARVQVRLADTVRAATSGADGRFAIGGVPPGSYVLTASIVSYALVRRSVTVAPGAVLDVTIVLTAGTGTYEETVDVVAPVFESREPGAVTEQVLTASELQDLRGMVADDPLRAAQAVPGVTATDDFSAEFSARGSGPGFTNIVLDGVPAASVLLHAVEGRDDTGSVARINTDVLAQATVLLGAYPQRYGDRLGAQLEFVSREGSRDGFHVRGIVSTVAASAVAEGPLAGGRGSWLAAFRQSYIDWVIRRIDPASRSVLGFSDAFGKLAFDLTPRHQVSLTAVAGRARYEEDDTTPGANSLATATSRGGLAILGLRSTGSSWLLHQRLFVTTNRFANDRADGEDLGWGRRGDVGYRADVARTWGPRVALDAGGHIRRSGERTQLWMLDRRVPPRRVTEESVDAGVWHGGGYGQVRWAPAGGVALAAGTRVDATDATHAVAFSPWVQVAQALGGGFRWTAGTGQYYQTPAFDQIVGVHGGGAWLPPQSAWHADASLEQVIGARTRWAVTLYNREERDVAWAAGLEPRAPGGLVPYNPFAVYAGRLEGYARGIEVVLQRRDPNGLSGWAAYAYGRSRYRDPATGESFDGDYDQRHSVNLYGSLRLWSRTTAIARFRAGTNIPVRGYYQATGLTDNDGLPTFVLGPARNVARLPDYARLDLRVNHAFTFSTRRLTLFVELINVLNRTNAGLSGGRSIEKLLPFIPAAGFLVEF